MSGATVLVPRRYDQWGRQHRIGFLAQRRMFAAEGELVSFAYENVRVADRADRERDPWETAASVLSASMALSRHAASKLVATAVELCERLPRTAALLAAGWIGLSSAHLSAGETRIVDDDKVDQLDQMISERLAPTRRRTHAPRLGPEAMVRTAAQDDPRSFGQLRAAGLLALCRGWTSLPELDGTCVFPGCQIDADRCELDHIVPFDHADPRQGGRTTSDDLGDLCSSHHRLKTDGIWAYYRDVDGSYVWIHGVNHPDRDAGTRIRVEPAGPLAQYGAPWDRGSTATPVVPEAPDDAGDPPPF